MADLTTTFAGITSPNPFWLASAPPTNSGYQVDQAFTAGWGVVKQKTQMKGAGDEHGFCETHKSRFATNFSHGAYVGVERVSGAVGWDGD
jgi:hypothetical protein